MLSIKNDTNSARRFDIAINYMKSHDSNKRVQGIKLYDEIIQSEHQLLSLKNIQQLQIIFECENNNDVLIRLSKLCMRIGLVSLFKRRICEFNINECDNFDNDFIKNVKECSKKFANFIWHDEKHNFARNKNFDDRDSFFNDIKDTVNVVVSLVPILQDIAEVDDILVRIETLRSLKSLINVMKFIIVECVQRNVHLDQNDGEKLILSIFDHSIGIFEKLASSDILSHKILSCYIIPIILEQKRLYDHFNDERNILLTNYSDFCTHPAPILRKHACKVFNSIMEEIEFTEDVIEILILPIIRNFCFDEQECVRLIAIENIQAFLLQIEIFQMNDNCTQSIFSYFEQLQPLIIRLCNDFNWRIRSIISKYLINIYIRLIYLESIYANEAFEIKESILGKEDVNETEYRTKNGTQHLIKGFCQKDIENIDIICNRKNFINKDLQVKSLECQMTNPFLSQDPKSLDNQECSTNQYPKYLQELAFILNQLLSDSEGETRNNTLSSILDFIEENLNYENFRKIEMRACKAQVSRMLFYHVIAPQVNDFNNTLLSDSYRCVRTNLSRVLTIIMIMKKSVNTNKNLTLKLDELFNGLIEKLVKDHDTQVRQSVVLALCSGIIEFRDNKFILDNIIPYSEILMQDSFWRVRYCCILLLTLSFYCILESYYNEEDIWSGNLNKNYPDDCFDDFFNANQKVPNILLDSMLGNISDRTSIVRQLTSIFVLPLISYWFGHGWTKKQLWNKLIMPLIMNENSYSLRSIGLLSANSIITSINVRSFKELRHVVQLIVQLIFTVIPVVDSKSNYEYGVQNVHKYGSEINNFDQYRSNNINPNLDLSTSGDHLHTSENSNLYSDIETLSCYLPLLNISNLILSYKPFEFTDSKDLVGFKSERNYDVIEFHLEIISTIIQYSTKDSVSNVRIKAFQAIHSFIKINGIKSCDRSIIDQIKYSCENDPDLDIRNYCMNILENRIRTK